MQLLEKLIGPGPRDYTIDAGGWRSRARPGRNLAYIAAFRSRDLVRAGGGRRRRHDAAAAESDPEHRLAVYAASAKKSPLAVAVAQTAPGSARQGAADRKELGDNPRDLRPAELAELVRWIDMLDRI